MEKVSVVLLLVASTALADTGQSPERSPQSCKKATAAAQKRYQSAVHAAERDRELAAGLRDKAQAFVQEYRKNSPVEESFLNGNLSQAAFLERLNTMKKTVGIAESQTCPSGYHAATNPTVEDQWHRKVPKYDIP